MFENTEAFGGFLVDDVGEASRFYGGTLGLRVSEEDEPMNLKGPQTKAPPTADDG